MQISVGELAFAPSEGPPSTSMPTSSAWTHGPAGASPGASMAQPHRVPAPLLEAAATPMPPSPAAQPATLPALPESPAVVRKVDSAKQHDEGMMHTLPEPLGGPPMSQKRYGADARFRDGLGDMDTRRLENAVWRLCAKRSNRGGSAGAEDEGTFMQKASQVIGQAFDFSHGPLRAKEDHVVTMFSGESLAKTWRSLDVDLSWPCSEKTRPGPEGSAAPRSLPEPLGGPAMSCRRFSVDSQGFLRRGDVDVRRLENAAWRLFLKEHLHHERLGAERVLPLPCSCPVGCCEEEAAFVQKAQDTIGWQIDFAGIRRLHLKKVLLPTQDWHNVLLLEPGSPEFLEHLAEVCKIFKSPQAGAARNASCDKKCGCFFPATGPDDILPVGAKGMLQHPFPCSESPRRRGENGSGIQGVRLMAAAAAAAQSAAGGPEAMQKQTGAQGMHPPPAEGWGTTAWVPAAAATLVGSVLLSWSRGR